MTKLYSIISKDHAGVHGVDVSLAAACARKNIEYVRLSPEDTTIDDLMNRSFESGSLLYRIRVDQPAVDAKATTIEAVLATLYTDKFTTIYYPRTVIYPRPNLQEMLEYKRHDLSIIPAAVVDETWKSMTDAELTRRAEKLGGFPIVLKTSGLSHGQGVYKIDAVDDLKQHLDTLTFTGKSTIAKKYLADYRHHRLIVVDGAAVAAIEYHKPDNDFRTNAAEKLDVSAVDVAALSNDVTELAVKAVEVRGSLLGGVDILVEQPNGQAYIAEANIPCYYARAEEPTGIDISGKLLDALIKKQKGGPHA